MDFVYNCKTGYIQADGKHNVYFEAFNNRVYPYIKNKKRRFLTTDETLDFKKACRWLIENCECDFGEEINKFCLSK